MRTGTAPGLGAAGGVGFAGAAGGLLGTVAASTAPSVVTGVPGFGAGLGAAGFFLDAIAPIINQMHHGRAVWRSVRSRGRRGRPRASGVYRPSSILETSDWISGMPNGFSSVTLLTERRKLSTCAVLSAPPVTKTIRPASSGSRCCSCS